MAQPSSLRIRAESTFASPFLDATWFPGLETLRANHAVLREEARAARPSMTIIEDWRVPQGTWAVLPFLAEEDDRTTIGDDVCRSNRALAPRTVALIDGVPGVKASTLSSLGPGATIASHAHQAQNVTAALCLQGGGSSSIEVDGETRNFVDGEWLIFDYTRPHGVQNHGTITRIVLLLAFANPTAALATDQREVCGDG